MLVALAFLVKTTPNLGKMCMHSVCTTQHDAGSIPTQSSHRFLSLGHIQSSLKSMAAFPPSSALPIAASACSLMYHRDDGHAALSPV